MSGDLITKENKEALEKELHFLSTVKRKEIVEAVQYAKSLGDLSENAEYHSSREEQGKLESRISVIEHILKTSKVVDKQGGSDIIDIGSIVVIKKEGEDNTRTFTIVGSEETDMLSGKISYKSPIGQALYRRKKGENTTVSTPKGEVVYTIVSVS